MPGRRRGGVGAVALALIACAASTSPRADSSFERIGVGAGFAMPTPSLSLFGRRDARWSGMATLGIGAELRINYEREGSNGGYWTAGAGYVLGALGVVRGGYGRGVATGLVALAPGGERSTCRCTSTTTATATPASARRSPRRTPS